MNSRRKFLLFSENLAISQRMFLISIVLSLGLGKWGAWIGFPKLGIFLIDVIFFSSLIIFRLTHSSRKKTSLLISLVVSTFILIQFTRTPDFSVSLRIRDLLPFIYLSFVPIMIDLLRFTRLNNMISAIRLGVVICLGWTIPITVGLLHPVQAPSIIFGVPIFTHRYDLTGIVLAIGIIAFMEFKSVNLASSHLMIFICLTFGLLQSSRAATIAILLAFIFQVLKSSRSIRIRYLLILPLIIIIVVSVLSIFPSKVSSIFANSSLSRIGIIGDNTEAAIGASNTYLARVRATNKMLSWFHEQDQNLFGVGPGTEMVQLSGAVRDLSGSLEVRAPHNWFIGLLVRFGYVGTLLWCVIVFGNIFRTKIQNSAEWMFLVIVICLVSSMGVIIESPFGSLPLSVMVAMTYVGGNEIAE